MEDRPLICSFASGPARELSARTWPTLVAYARRHGYDTHFEHERTCERPPSWECVRMLQQQLAERPLVLWVDADAYVVDETQDLRDHLDPASVWSVRTTVGPLGQIPNCGVIAARPSTFTRSLLAAMWEQTDLIDHAFWEQAAFMRLCGFTSTGVDERGLPSGWRREHASPWWDGVSALPDAFNSMVFAPVADPVIEHMAGMPHEQRLLQLDERVHAR